MQELAIVSLSGGKDSTATAGIAIEKMGKDRCRFVFADTGNEHELTYEYLYDYLPGALGIEIDVLRANFDEQIHKKRAYIAENWERKGVTAENVARAVEVMQPTGVPFLDLCLWKNRFPSRRAQFCTLELKRNPLDQYLMDYMVQGYRVQSWRGIRRDESQNRSDAVEIEEMAEGYSIVQPIVTWTAQDVVDYVINDMKIQLNPLYKMGMGRVGCFPCINCNKDELSEIARRFPQHIDKIRDWEHLVGLASKQHMASFFCDKAKKSRKPTIGWTREKDEDGRDIWIEPDASVYNRVRIDQRVAWSMTTRGGRDFDMFKQGPSPMCKSAYGLCE